MRPASVPQDRTAPPGDPSAEAPAAVTHPAAGSRPSAQRPVKRRVARGEGATADTEASPDDIQRWTARRRMALVLGILKGELSPEEVARRHGLATSEIDDWKDRMLVAGHNALRSRPRDEEAVRDEQIRRLKQKVGELVLEVDMLRDALNNARAPVDGDGADD